MDLLAGIRRATYSVNQLLTMTRADASMESEPETIEAAVLVRMASSAGRLDCRGKRCAARDRTSRRMFG